MAHQMTAYKFGNQLFSSSSACVNLCYKAETTHQSSRQENQHAPSPPPALHDPLDGILLRRDPEVLHVARHCPARPLEPAHRLIVTVVVVLVRVVIVTRLERGRDEGAVANVHAAPVARREQGGQVRGRRGAVPAGAGRARVPVVLPGRVLRGARYGAEAAQQGRRVRGVLACGARGLGAGDEGEEVGHP